MSDVNYSFLPKNKYNIDMIDEDWVRDALSDDEVEEPKDAIDLAVEDGENEVKNEDYWMELGTDVFMIETLHAPNVLEGIREAGDGDQELSRQLQQS
jgi:hypothetical protein